MRRLIIFFLLLSLLSCAKTPPKAAEPELDNSQGSLAIHGLTIFGYENNQLSYQLKSRYLIQSLDKNQLEFGDFVMQKIDEAGINSLYLANKVIYSFKDRQAVLEQANLEDYRDEVILSADNLLIDYISNTLVGKHAEITRPNQQIAGQNLFYDLISRRLEFTENVEGHYEQETSQ